MAWFAGVVLPLLVITGAPGWAGARRGIDTEFGNAALAHDAENRDSRHGHRDCRSAPRAIGIVSVVLIGALLLGTTV